MNNKTSEIWNFRSKKETIKIVIFNLFSILVVIYLVTGNVIAQPAWARVKGKVVAEGKNTKMIEGENFKLLSYRLEVLPIPPSSDFSANNKTQSVDEQVRLVLIGEFPRSPYIVWVNGVGILTWAATANELHVSPVFYPFFENRKFEEGSEILVSRRESRDFAVELPEAFVIPKEFSIPHRSEKELQQNIELNFTDCDAFYLLNQKKNDCVSITVRNSYVSRNPHSLAMSHSWYLQIGNKEIPVARDGFVITVKEFEQLKDGEWVVLKTAREVYGGISVGKLNKSSLNDKK